MRQSQLPLVGLMLALFFGARAALPGSQPSSSGTAASARGGKQKVDTSTPPVQLPPVWEALCKLNPEYGSTAYLLHRSILETPATNRLDPPCLNKKKLDIFSVIAAVPDPVHTHLGLSFDRTIDANQTAASEADTPYFPYLNALPWPPPQEKSDAAGKETVSDYQYPGVLVFRRSESHPDDSPDKHDRPVGPRYLAVFLVPELPTSGIDRPTFLAAVRIMNKISPDSTDTIALLGPNFSGSVELLPSLRTQLTAQLRSQSKFQHRRESCIQAISGSVTNAGDPFVQQQSSADCASTFTALQSSDHEANTSFIRTMRSSGYCPGEIAILTEDGTEYGRSDEKLKSDPKSKSDSGCKHKQRPLFLHFPREISKLRNAYGPSITQQSQKDKTQAANSPALSLNWQDAHPYIRDDVRNYGEQTAVSEETVLASLATTIKSQRIKALGILATDPLDTAFLIHSFRNSSPDIRIFLRDPDLLYLRTPDLGSTNGIMVINNFPLVPQNQFWREDSHDDVNHLILLPTAQQEAAHSAFLLLLKYKLWHPPLQLPPQAMFKPLDGEWPAEPSRSFEDWMRDKPLWLGVTGTAGYYPVRFLSKENEDISAHEQVAALHSLKIGRPPYATMLLLLLIGVVGVFHACWATFPATVPSRFEDEFDFSNKADTIAVRKGFCHVLALLSLTLASLLVSSSFYFFWHTPYSVRRIPVYQSGAILALVVTIILVSAAVWRLVDSVLRPWVASKRGTSSSNRDVIKMGELVSSIPWAVALTIFVAPIVYWPVVTLKSTYENAFLHYRDLYLASGVAPVLPGLLLVAIAYLGILAYLRRVTYWEYGSVKTPALPLDDTFPSDFTANVNSIDGWMLGIPGTSKKHVLLYLLFFTVSVLALRPWATIDALEGQWVHWFLVAGFTFSFFIISVNWVRFTAIWRQLRTILRGLEQLPLRLAFDRLPRESSLPIWSWNIHDRTFLPIVQAVDTLRALVRADPGAISAESVKKLKSGTLALASFQETPRAFAMTADGTMPVPLRRRESDRTPTSGPDMGNVTKIRSGPSDARATGASAKTTSTEQKQVMHDARGAMTQVIQELSEMLLRDYWNRGGVGLRTEPNKIDPADRKYVLAEDLVALRFYSYIRYVVSELRNLMFLLALSFSLLYLSLHVYSFRAGQAIEWSFIVLFLVMGGGVFWVLLQMERDALLSRLEGTQAGQLNKQFYINLLKYAVVPLLTVFGSHVPAVSNFLLTKLQPTLEVFR